MQELTKKIEECFLAPDEEFDYRIESGIELHRKGYGKLEILGGDGTPLQAAKVTYKQLDHEFKFGANAFMLDMFDSNEENQAYRERFKDLFNLAVLPFYWNTLEPEEGNPRFAKDSIPIPRRPSIDLLLEYCEAHQIEPKGHPLLWGQFAPDWAPNSYSEAIKKIERHIREIAERYGERIPTWDVVNESTIYDPLRASFWDLPQDYITTAFKLAERHLPYQARLYHNDHPSIWKNYQRENSQYYQLLKNLLAKGLKIDGIGIQFHLFLLAERLLDQFPFYLEPERLFAVLDLYNRFELPISISEVTIPGYLGEELQARMIEKYYKIWFSSQNVESIVYWNSVDGTGFTSATRDENVYQGGIMHRNMEPKAAYRTLQRLVQDEWCTSDTIEYHWERRNKLQGFYGNYELIIEAAGGREKHLVTLAAHGRNAFTIQTRL